MLVITRKLGEGTDIIHSATGQKVTIYLTGRRSDQVMIAFKDDDRQFEIRRLKEGIPVVRKAEGQ